MLSPHLVEVQHDDLASNGHQSRPEDNLNGQLPVMVVFDIKNDVVKYFNCDLNRTGFRGGSTPERIES